MKTIYKNLLWLILIISIGTQANGQVFYTLDFETVGGYTTSDPEASDGFNDFFTRTDGTNVNASYVVNGPQGSFYFAAQDIDADGANDPNISSGVAILSIDDIDISGRSNIRLKIMIAEDDDGTNQDWDSDTYFFIEYDIDNSGSFTKVLQVAAEGGTNTVPRLDTDFDGTGEGTEITENFQTFTVDIPATGSVIDIQLIFEKLDAGDEDIAIDNIQLEEASTAPSITVAGALSPFNTMQGTASEEQSYTVAGANLTEDITITAPTGIEISTTSGSGFTNSLVLMQTGGNVANTTIYARVASTAPVGSISGNIEHTSTGATSQNVAVSGSVFTTAAYDLQVTEIWFGNEVGDDLTEDWFEITNNGTEAWVAGTNPDLYYDDQTPTPANASLIEGVTDIQPGESVVVLITNNLSGEVDDFKSLWSPVTNLTGIEVGYTEGADLSNGGDAVALWVNVPSMSNTPVDEASYAAPTAADYGASYDVSLADFSTVGNANDAVETSANGSSETAIGSPGNKGPVEAIAVSINELRISSSGASDDNSNYIEIFGENGTSLDGYALVVVSSEFSPGNVDFVFDLSGTTIDDDNVILIRNADLASEISQAVIETNDVVADFDFFGSPVTFMIVSSFTGAVGDDLDTDDDGVFDLEPWAALVSSVSLIDGDANTDYPYSSTTVGPQTGNTDFTPSGVYRNPDNTGDFEQLAFDDFSVDTPGALNNNNNGGGGPTALQDQLQAGKLSIFPNPSEGFYTMTIEGEAVRKAEVEVYNTTGRLLLSDSVESKKGEFFIDITDLPSGKYLLKLKVGQEYIARRIIKY